MAIIASRLGIWMWTDTEKGSSKVGQEEYSQVFVYHYSHHISFSKNSCNSPGGNWKGLPSISLRKKLGPREVGPGLCSNPCPVPPNQHGTEPVKGSSKGWAPPHAHCINDGDLQSSGAVFFWALVRFKHRRKISQLIFGWYCWS